MFSGAGTGEKDSGRLYLCLASRTRSGTLYFHTTMGVFHNNSAKLPESPAEDPARGGRGRFFGHAACGKYAQISACLLLLAMLAGLIYLFPRADISFGHEPHTELGEEWLFAVSEHLNNLWFPFLPVTLAVLKYHLPAWLHWLQYVMLLLPVPLAFSAGALLHSLRAGLSAALFSSVLCLWLARYGNLPYALHAEQALITASVILTISVLALRLSSARTKSLLIGLAMSMTLYAKGVTAPLLAGLLLYVGLKEKEDETAATPWLPAAVILVSLAVWILANAAASNEFTLLENATRSDDNICTGAAGFVSTVEGNSRSLLHIGPGESVMFWAIRETVSHPVRYLLAIAKRAHYILFGAPLVPGLQLLALCAAWAVFSLRRMQPVRPLLFSALYFFGIHLLMPVEGRYFIPGWYFFCILAGVSAAEISGKRAACAAGEEATARFVLVSCGAPIASLWFLSFLLLAAYPVRNLTPQDPKKLLQKHTSIPRLYTAAAEQEIAAGNPAAAAEYYDKAYRLTQDPQDREKRAKARFLSGASASELISEYSSPADDKTVIFSALLYAEEGAPQKADRALSCAMQLCIRHLSGMRYVSTAEDEAHLRGLRQAASTTCLGKLQNFLAMLPTRREALLRAQLKRSSPWMLRPETVFARYLAENSASGAVRAAYPGSRAAEPKDCAGLLPDR